MESRLIVIIVAMTLLTPSPYQFMLSVSATSMSMSGGMGAEMKALSDLQSGLLVHKTILAALLPQPDSTVPSDTQSNADFYSILKSLSELSEQERRISALLTISEHQSNAELMALQAVFEKLVENACNLMRTKLVDPVNCTYNDLMKLKLKLEAFFLSSDSIKAMVNHGFVGTGINRHGWLADSVVCQLTDEGVSLLNRIFANSGSFDKSNC